MSYARDDIVVTGTGLVTCQGLTVDDNWQGVLECRRAMGLMPALESPIPAGQTGGQAPELPSSFMPDAVREVRYLRWAINEALAQSHDTASFPEPHRVGVILGTTLHGIRQGGQFLRNGDTAPLHHFLATGVLQDALAGLPITGPALTTCSACSSGLATVAMGVTLLRAGLLDAVIVGGYDPVSEYVYAGFSSLRLVAAADLMPFTKGRDGMKLAEGYAILILERAEDAHQRGATPIARISGYGESADAHHLTQPHPGGEGAARAATAALDMADIKAEVIGLCSAHATATPNNDAAEFAALRTILGDRVERTPVVAFKSHLGHTLGAAGAAELILSMRALSNQVVPPTANTRTEALEFPIGLNTGEPAPTPIAATMNMSLGFGGANTCVIAEPARIRRPILREQRQHMGHAYITGVGVVTPGLIGNAAFAARLADPNAAPITADAGNLSDESIALLTNARRVRRMSEYVKATLAATAEAFRDSGIEDPAEFSAGASAILGTTLGSTSFSESYYRQVITEGMGAANPSLFAEGVPNAAAAQLSLVFGVKGGCQTIIGSRTSGLDALWLASIRIASGEWDRAIVSAGEEQHHLLNQVLTEWGYHPKPGFRGTPRAPRGFYTGSGAVTLILESSASIRTRGATTRGVIHPTSCSSLRAESPRQHASSCRRAVEGVGEVEAYLSSSNGTWLDRIEAAALKRAGFLGPTTSLDGYIPELFSATPLAGIAAATLLDRRLPSPLFTSTRHDWSRQVRALGVLATDPSGVTSAVRISLGHFMQ